MHIYCNTEHFCYFEDYIRSIMARTPCTLTVFNNNDKLVFDVTDKLLFFSSYADRPANSWFVNMEQLTIPTQRASISSKRAIDYSKQNITLYPEPGVIYLPYQVNPSEILNLPKTIDVGFVGAMSKRRSEILNNLRRNKIDVKQIFGWNQARDDTLFRCKILVNLHFNETYNIMEQVRCDRCVFNQVIVVSEPSLDDSLLELKDYMIICSANDMPARIKAILSNYEDYHARLFGTFDLNLISAKLDTYVQAFVQQED